MKVRIFRALSHIGVGTAGGAAIGYLIGALIGIGMTWHNNNVLVDVPQGSYLFWANFMGLMTAIWTTPVGVLIGLVVGLGRNVPEQERGAR